MSNVFIDITGQRFGILTAIKYIGGNGRRWKCKCDCGNTRLAGSYTLRDGRCKSCGCDNPNKFIDITGKHYGKLTVISFNRKEKSKGGHEQYFWNCKCDCGNDTIVRRGHLRTGKIVSCGCLLMRIGKNHPNFKGYEKIPMSYYNRVRRGAVIRNFEFNISLEYLWKLFLKQNQKCALTGRLLSFDKTDYDTQTASLDRIDSLKGYTEDNVQWVHKIINNMKMDTTVLEFIKLCKEVADYRKDTNES